MGLEDTWMILGASDSGAEKKDVLGDIVGSADPNPYLGPSVISSTDVFIFVFLPIKLYM